MDNSISSPMPGDGPIFIFRSSRKNLILRIIILAVYSLAFLTFFTWKPGLDRYNIWVVLILFIPFIVAIYNLFSACTFRYYLFKNQILVKMPFRKVAIPLRSITIMGRYGFNRFRNAFWIGTTYIYKKNTGNMRLLAPQIGKDSILIETNLTKSLISPENPDEFIKRISALLRPEQINY